MREGSKIVGPRRHCVWGTGQQCQHSDQETEVWALKHQRLWFPSEKKPHGVGSNKVHSQVTQLKPRRVLPSKKALGCHMPVCPDHLSRLNCGPQNTRDWDSQSWENPTGKEANETDLRSPSLSLEKVPGTSGCTAASPDWGSSHKLRDLLHLTLCHRQNCVTQGIRDWVSLLGENPTARETAGPGLKHSSDSTPHAKKVLQKNSQVPAMCPVASLDPPHAWASTLYSPSQTEL